MLDQIHEAFYVSECVVLILIWRGCPICTQLLEPAVAPV